MSNLTITAHVTRTELGKGVLQLNDGDNYRVSAVGFDPGAVTHRTEYATSPYVQGGLLVNAVRDLVQGGLTVDIYADTHAELQTLIGDLVEAVSEQRTYDLHVVIEGQTYAWRCDRSDYSVGWVHERLHALVVPFTIQFNRDPNPIQGPI